MSFWYYDDGQGSAMGPFDEDQLRQLIAEGRVVPSSYVLRGGTTNWVPLSSVAAELGLAPSTPPPPPVPAAPAVGGGGFAPPSPEGFRVGYQAPSGPGLSPNGRPLARWLRRVGAALLDGLIVGIPVNIVLGVAHLTVFKVDRITYTDGRSDTIKFHFGVGGFIISMVAYIVYQGLLNGITGQTVGKRVARTRVVDAQSGTLIGGGRGLGRAAIHYVFTWLCIVGLIDDLFPLWDQRRQSLHDKVARTVVEIID